MTILIQTTTQSKNEVTFFQNDFSSNFQAVGPPIAFPYRPGRVGHRSYLFGGVGSGTGSKSDRCCTGRGWEMGTRPHKIPKSQDVFFSLAAGQIWLKMCPMIGLNALMRMMWVFAWGWGCERYAKRVVDQNSVRRRNSHGTRSIRFYA